MRKESNAAMIAGMEYGIYILQGDNLYDAATASGLKDSGEWVSKNAHVVVFCENMVFQIEGSEGENLPFSAKLRLNGNKVFDAYEAIHTYDKEALELTRELAVSGCSAANSVLMKGEGWFLPSLGHLLAIHHYKDEINSIIDEYTEDSRLISDFYWSCNQRDAANAWHVTMANGIINYYSNKTNTYRVRSISAIDLNTLTLHLLNNDNIPEEQEAK